MDEEKAAKTLTAEIVKRFGSKAVKEKVYKDRLFSTASHCFQVSGSFIMGYDRFYFEGKDTKKGYYNWKFVNSQLNELNEKGGYICYSTIEQAAQKKEDCDSANYFFIDDQVMASQINGNSNKGGMSFFVTPYSVIGKKEIENLRNMFYKDLPHSILSAMHTLKIEDYVELYRIYSQGGVDEQFLEDYSDYLKLTASLSSLKWGVSSGCVKTEALETLLGTSLDDFNRRNKYKKIPSSSDSSGSYVYKYNIQDTIEAFVKYASAVKYEALLPGFLGFVFSLPCEEQNLGENKNILKIFARDIDYIEVLAQEYSKGGHFEDYFSCLDSKKQMLVVDSLRPVSERNPICDSFLWSNGFKDVGLDYLRLYREDADGFIGYFSSRSLVEKKVMLKDVMGCDFVNEKVVNWLNEKEHDLVREVGLNG